MSTSILCQDIIGILLVLIKGDINLDFEEVMLAAEAFQKRNNRTFGQEPTCLRGLFFVGLSWKIADTHPVMQRLNSTPNRNACTLRGIQLCEVITLILPFFDAHFCDEGDYWTGQEALGGGLDINTREGWESSHGEWWYGYNWEEYHRELQMKQDMEQLFLSAVPPPAERVRLLMRRHGLDEKLLYRCSMEWPANC